MVKNSKKMRKKRYKLKSSFKRFLVFFVFFLGMFIYTIKESIIIYKDFQYRKTDEFKIIAKGYSLDDARHLLDNLGEQYIEFIIKNEYDENYIKILNNKYFLEKNFLKYIEYEKYHEDDEIDNIIAIVNVHANFGWYNASIESDVGNEFMVLVNKFYHLNGDFSRDDIVNIPLSYRRILRPPWQSRHSALSWTVCSRDCPRRIWRRAPEGRWFPTAKICSAISTRPGCITALWRP